jgi:hypothetical protein
VCSQEGGEECTSAESIHPSERDLRFFPVRSEGKKPPRQNITA